MLAAQRWGKDVKANYITKHQHQLFHPTRSACHHHEASYREMKHSQSVSSLVQYRSLGFGLLVLAIVTAHRSIRRFRYA